MGLCFSDPDQDLRAHGVRRSDSVRARKDLKFFKLKDLERTQPLFELLSIKKTLQQKMYKMYESVCQGGKGSLHNLFDEFRINRCDWLYFERCFQYFNPGHKSFTFPQFVLCTWNFLSLQGEALGEWTFRVYFGGVKCSPHSTATLNEVFHFMDITYGISREMDYNPHSEYREKMMHTGNSHEFDVKKARNLVRSIAQNKKEIGIDEFLRLIKKSPALLNRVFATQLNMRKQLKGTAHWEKCANARSGVSEFDSTIVRIEKTHKSIFEMDPHKKDKDSHIEEERRQRHERHVAAVKTVREGHSEGAHQQRAHRTKMAGYNKKKNVRGKKGPSKYVANVAEPEFTGRVHAEDHHHHAATTIQRILSRGSQGRHKMRSHRAQNTGRLVSETWHEVGQFVNCCVQLFL